MNKTERFIALRADEHQVFGPKVIRNTRSSAEDDANDLARANPGGTYLICQIIDVVASSVQATKVPLDKLKSTPR